MIIYTFIKLGSDRSVWSKTGAIIDSSWVLNRKCYRTGANRRESAGYAAKPMTRQIIWTGLGPTVFKKCPRKLKQRRKSVPQWLIKHNWRTYNCEKKQEKNGKNGEHRYAEKTLEDEEERENEEWEKCSGSEKKKREKEREMRRGRNV